VWGCGGVGSLLTFDIPQTALVATLDTYDFNLLSTFFRLKEHVDDHTKLPILIFPEGTCINNTSVMQFKKGSFEVGGTIYPVAIKYDPIFGDAFWNSSQNGMASYIYLMMTSWAIVCDVWYLPPMTREGNEDAIHFANRVKAEIARQGGLVDLMW
jgi:glycerol-3-phosphate O-acyltransferase 3/4